MMFIAGLIDPSVRVMLFAMQYLRDLYEPFLRENLVSAIGLNWQDLTHLQQLKIDVYEGELID